MHHLDKGERLLDRGKFDEAIAELSKAIKGEASDVTKGIALLHRGNAHLKVQKYEEAVGDFTQAIGLVPDFDETLIGRAKAHYLLSLRADQNVDYTEDATNAAIADCTEAIRLNQNAWEAFEIRGRCFRFFDDDEEAWEKAIADFTRVIELQPQNSQAFADRAEAYFCEPGYNDLASADVARVLELDPANVTALLVRGQLALAARNYRQAIQDFDAILQSEREADSETMRIGGVRYDASELREEAQKLHELAREKQRQPRHNAPSELLFWGDGICPNCRAAVWIEWKLAYPISQMIQCHACHARWDVEQAVSIVFSHVPEDNAPESSLAKIRQYIAIKKATENLVEQVESRLQCETSNSEHSSVPTAGQTLSLYSGSGVGRQYFDCPICGKGYFAEAFDSGNSVTCSECGSAFRMEDGLNRRTTPQRVEKRGWLGRLFFGSTIQSSVREQLERRAGILESMIRLAMLNGNYQEAQFLQLRLNDIRRRLDSLYE